MAARFGDLPDINAFERALYEGTDASCALPDKRWRFLGEDPAFYKKIGATRDTRGCFIGSVDVDFKRLRTPLVPEDQLIPQQLLALSTIDRALLDSGLPKGGRVAVIVGRGKFNDLGRDETVGCICS